MNIKEDIVFNGIIVFTITLIAMAIFVITFFI